MSHFWLSPLCFHKKTTFFVTYNLPWLQQHFNIFDSIWLWRPLFVMSEEEGNFQPITELSYKVARSRNLDFPCPIGPWSYTPTDDEFRWRSPEGKASAKMSLRDVNKKMSAMKIRNKTKKVIWCQTVLWKINGDSQKCHIFHLLFNKDSNGKH